MIPAPMSASEHNPAASALNSTAEWVGYLSVVPLLACLAGVGLLSDYGARELAQRIALGWGAVLLASSGAVHWGLALGGRLPWAASRIGGALLPAPIAAAALVLGGERGLALLVVGSGGFWLYEHRAVSALLPPAYLALRRNLTLATCMVLALTMFASDAAGLT